MSKGQKERAKELAGRAIKKGTKAGNAPIEEKKERKEKGKEKATAKEKEKGCKSYVMIADTQAIKRRHAQTRKERAKEHTDRKLERDGE